MGGLRDSFLSGSVRLGEGLALALPPRILLGLAEAAGRAGWWLSARRRRVAHENLRIAFGDALDRAGRARLGRRSCAGLARVVAETALATRLLGARRQRGRRLVFQGAWDALAADVAAGRGGLVVTAHLGNWEVGGLMTRQRGVPLKAMARTLRHLPLESWLERLRGGAEVVIPKAGGVKGVLRVLRAGGWVALLADQNAGRHGVFVPFFGLAASTHQTPAALALRLGCPLYLGICLRRRGPLAFDIHLERLRAPAVAPADAARAFTALLNERLETWIRRAPEQYNWIHRRWKTRPPGRDGGEPGQPAYARLWPAGHPKTAQRERGAPAAPPLR